MKKVWIIGGIVAVLILAGVGLFLWKKDKAFTGYEVVREMDGSDTATYVCVDKKLIRYGQEGARAIDKDGNLIWNITYSTMKNPVYSFCGSVMAMADVGAKTYLIADGTGISQTFSTPYEIQAISVAKQGVIAVMMNAEDKDYIYLFDKEGKVLAEIETVVARDGFPITLALSEDGTKLATSYTRIVDDEPVGCITFYNFGGVGKSYTRNLVGQFQYAGSMIPRISFWDNDTVAAVGEDVLELFSMKEIPSEIAKKEIKNTIRSIAFGDYLCMISRGADGNEILEAYDKSGEVRMMKVITFPYVGFQTSGKDIVLYSYSGCEVYTVGKGLVFSGTFENGVRNLFTIGQNRYYLVEDKKERVIRLVH